MNSELTFVERQEEQLRRAMARALRKHGNVRDAAAEIGMSKSTFFDRARRFGLDTTRNQ